MGDNTSKPLCRGRKIRHEDGEVGWVRFKYERLPNLCYWCGRLSHSDKDCELWIRSQGTLMESDRQFRAWLRAPSFINKKSFSVKVSGMEDDRNGEDLNDDEEGLEMEGANIGEVGDPEKETDTTGNPRAISGLTMVVGTQQEEAEVVIMGKTKISECISGDKSDFQVILQDIDAEIAKFDSPAEGFTTFGPRGEVGQPEALHTQNEPNSTGSQSEEYCLNKDLGSPLELKGHKWGWKRLIHERDPVEMNTMQTQGKRPLRDEEDVPVSKIPRKKLCVSTVEALSQPHREP